MFHNQNVLQIVYLSRCYIQSQPFFLNFGFSPFSSWGRWKDILNHGRFKKQLTERDVESICRALLAYCLVHYRGDDKIKSFMWDLIAPTEDGQTKELQNHLGEGLFKLNLTDFILTDRI